jgi:hypothetical protein
MADNVNYSVSCLSHKKNYDQLEVHGVAWVNRFAKVCGSKIGRIFTVLVFLTHSMQKEGYYLMKHKTKN